MERILGKAIRKVRIYFFFAIDLYYDMRICGRSLSKYIPSVYRDDKNGIGMTGSQSTYYGVLKKIFKNVEIKKEDSFLDIGCGMGRVLAFCLKERYTCSINGIEINEIPGKIAKSWIQRYNNVNVIIGDAFKLNFDQYSIFFLGRPFLPKTFAQFVNLFESQITHPITLIYWVDQQSGFYLMDRTGWKLKKRECIRKVYGVKIPAGIQGYSIWEYKPEKEVA